MKLRNIFSKKTYKEDMSKKKNIMVLTGSGVSAESGIPTFRDSVDGLWMGYDVESVATARAWKDKSNRENVLDFHNTLRRRMSEKEPNNAHKRLVDLEKDYNVYIITQNVDDLHEKAGSSNVLHIHGELTKARSTVDPKLVVDIKYDDINIGDKCSKGSQLRPHTVLFEENVLDLGLAAGMVKEADILLIIGTSFTVYPAAGLMDYAKDDTPIYIVDPGVDDAIKESISERCTIIEKPATVGIEDFISCLD